MRSTDCRVGFVLAAIVAVAMGAASRDTVAVARIVELSRSLPAEFRGDVLDFSQLGDFKRVKRYEQHGDSNHYGAVESGSTRSHRSAPIGTRWTRSPPQPVASGFDAELVGSS